MFRSTCVLSVIPRILNSAQYKVQVKVKFTLEQAAKAQRGEYRYNSTLYLTSALEVVGGQRHSTPSPRPLYRR